MTDFASLGLAAPLLRALEAEGYRAPTPIQAGVIPAMLTGQDVLGLAQTGTGKTAAFVLPLLNRIHAMADRPAQGHCFALILTPTRELATQIADTIRRHGRHIDLTVAVVVGGVKPGPQRRLLADGLDIVVATPGRLMDHMSAGHIRLSQTSTIVLDEADQMLDMGFVPAVRRILAALPRQRQTILMSATMPSTIRALANDFLQKPLEVKVAEVSRPVERIDQRVLLVEAGAKPALLLTTLADPTANRTIVFTRTKHGADKVAKHLERAGLVAAAIHGNKSQGQRDRALAHFRQAPRAVLVATDVAARGIDIDGVTHVINYDMPNVPEAYVHRIGRTARAGRSGMAISLCDASERGLLRDIEKLIGLRLPGEVIVDGLRQPRPEASQEPRPSTPSKDKQGRGQGQRQRSKSTVNRRSHHHHGAAA